MGSEVLIEGYIDSVVRTCEPWALVVVRTMAGSWVVVSISWPPASVEVKATFIDAVTAAVVKLVESIIWPCAFVLVIRTGTSAAVPDETIEIPRASVVVMGVATRAIGEAGGSIAIGYRLIDVAIVPGP